MKISIVATLAVMAASGCASAPGDAQTERTTDAPALSADATHLARLVAGAADAADAADAEATRSLANVREVVPGGSTLRLAEGFPIRFVGLAPLQRYDGRAPLDAILAGSNDRVYPVLDGGQVVASVAVHRDVDGAWHMSAIGTGDASGRLLATRDELRRAHAADGDAYEIVRAPALGERFLAHRERGAAFLTSLKEGAPSGPRPAVDVLAELASRAQSEHSLE